MKKDSETQLGNDPLPEVEVEDALQQDVEPVGGKITDGAEGTTW